MGEKGDLPRRVLALSLQFTWVHPRFSHPQLNLGIESFPGLKQRQKCQNLNFQSHISLTCFSCSPGTGGKVSLQQEQGLTRALPRALALKERLRIEFPKSGCLELQMGAPALNLQRRRGSRSEDGQYFFP